MFQRGYQPYLNRMGYALALQQRAVALGFRDLWDAEFRVYSQNGEDGILNYVCECLTIDKPTFLEFGVGAYEECNSRFIVECRHGSAVAVDADLNLLKNVSKLAASWRGTIIPLQEWITRESAPRIVSEWQRKLGQFDILSLDIDGNDYWVAEALDLTGIRILVVEYNPLFGGTIPVSVPVDDQFDRTEKHFSNLYYGASLPAFVELFTRRGYAFLGSNRMNNNAFFVTNSQRHLIPLPNIESFPLSRYTDGRSREGRDAKGRLTYATRIEQLASIAELPLVNTVTGGALKVRDCVDR